MTARESEKHSTQPEAKPAAQYIRMSTEHQQYSTENQADAIREYAQKRGFRVVRTYADEGRSGLRIEGRRALQLMINDAKNGNAEDAVIAAIKIMEDSPEFNAGKGAVFNAAGENE